MMDYRFPSFTPGSLTLIVGLGQTGVAAARWCAARGERLRVLDTRAQPAGLKDLAALDADFRLGADHFTPATLQDVQRLVLSPGLSPLQAPQRSLLAHAAQAGIPIQGEMELFALALQDLREQGYAPRVVGITGTNGKTTVVSMTRALASGSGLDQTDVRAAGNIGPAALAALMDALDAGHLPSIWVLELSSFQLQTTRSLRLDAAAVLNLTQDHLDWHGDMAAYGSAKKRLLGMAEVAIVNRDDKTCLAMVEESLALNARTFGAGQAAHVGDLGLENDHGLAWLAAVQADDEALPEPPKSASPRRRKKDAVDAPVLRQTGKVVRLMPVDALRVRGRHHALNALAALALGRVLGLGWGDMLRALRDYAGEPHRCQFVRTVGGIAFVNDSKATNVGATLAALEGMGGGSAQTVLIAGGQGKGQDFSPLAAALARHARAVVLLGQDAPRIAEALADTQVPCEQVASMPEAVARALAVAREGDTVLLSPACASLDMFRDYAQRGAAFVEAVQELALEEGEVQ